MENPEFCEAVRTIVDRIFPEGYDTSSKPPNSMYELTLHMARTGRMCVRQGDDADPANGFDGAATWEGFRAWHDWCHVQGNFGFDIKGECKAVAMQLAMLRALFPAHKVREWEPIIAEQIIKDNFGDEAFCPITNYK